jgi:PleD family two-component response regulator
MQATHNLDHDKPVPAPFILLAETHGGTINDLKALAAQRGLRIEVVTNGHQAIEVLKRITPIGAILSADLAAPSGIDVCSQMRRLRRLRHIPVVMTSNFRDSRIADASKLVRADALIIKPIHRDVAARALDQIAFGTIPGSWPNPRDTQTLNPRLSQIR